MKGLFRFRNRVVHDNLEPSHDEAKERLGVARMLVERLRVTQEHLDRVAANWERYGIPEVRR